MAPQEGPSQPQPSLDGIVSDEEVRVAAARRARETHRERREGAANADRERIEAIFLRLQQAADSRRERSLEERAIRADAERRHIDLDTERQRMAQQRYLEARVVQEQNLRAVVADRPQATNSAVRAAQKTHQERESEAEAAASPTGVEYRLEMQRRAEIAARVRHAREEREREAATAQRDHQSAVALLVQQAREARREREHDGMGEPAEAAGVSARRESQAFSRVTRSKKRRQRRAVRARTAREAQRRTALAPGTRHPQAPVSVARTERPQAPPGSIPSFVGSAMHNWFLLLRGRFHRAGDRQRPVEASEAADRAA